ncbi:MAG: hypothetical protein CO183_02380 [Candidatus Zambryskibacteria bacterium CG_4_9_14_3_um_filter_42_9]|uniref:Baseplate protein J-like domain-containing protein n=1 Tax=Candidatus Zambryskibacteria bacterium CG22_combo_CG10-13_8_21_14_all_42_17 TaxID=1975118 RepID=A0A2H0BDE4_9BACT|nr:MAG: hypothetical protein COX06_01795 [Candidatus Zambryskibacteria bacterium CG22_combo_CG10-13_8_21_14_all_42_17]PJA36644.1 MAG: hypothetical protein CO183_02380 [Candidatus Zambryskibacteria bacterium CG_4_9_14_3_um_filter_42_9]
MTKNIEDIIIPERKRSIRDIPIPERRKKQESPDHQFLHKENYPPEPQEDLNAYHQNNKNNSPFPQKRLWLIVTAVSTLVIIFALLLIFNGATLTYVPKSSAISFNEDVYTASKTSDKGLLYSIVKLSVDKGVEVPASGEVEVVRKASGVIIIYNNNNASQRLRATTRFETPDGKIYQIEDSIIVPGRSIVGGKEQPGTLEVRVLAENYGEDFNIGLSDFTLPGLQGTSLFSTIYARSKTEMTGGFVGTEKIASEQDRRQAKIELDALLREELISEARAQVPEDFIMFPSLSSVTFDDLPQTQSQSEDTTMINMRGNLSGLMFKRSDLSNQLSLNKITVNPGESVTIPELKSLELTFVGILSVDLLLPNEIEFTVTGDATAVWQTDEVALKADLIGKHKKDIPSILKNYPTVLSATVTIRPFWKSSFPRDGSRITIKKSLTE